MEIANDHSILIAFIIWCVLSSRFLDFSFSLLSLAWGEGWAAVPWLNSQRNPSLGFDWFVPQRHWLLWGKQLRSSHRNKGWTKMWTSLFTDRFSLAFSCFPLFLETSEKSDNKTFHCDVGSSTVSSPLLYTCVLQLHQHCCHGSEYCW